MEKDVEEYIKTKIALTLNILLERNKETNRKINSYGKIAINAEIRKATVTKIFNADSTPNSITLISIINALGYSLTEFAQVYESLTERHINEFNAN